MAFRNTSSDFSEDVSKGLYRRRKIPDAEEADKKAFQHIKTVIAVIFAFLSLHLFDTLLIGTDSSDISAPLRRIRAA